MSTSPTSEQNNGSPGSYIPAAPARTWMLQLWGAGILLSGIVIGAAGAVMLRPPPPPSGFHGLHEGPGPGAGRNMEPTREGPQAFGNPQSNALKIAAEMNERLQLNSEQTKQVTAAYTTTLEAIEKLRSDVRPKVAAEQDKLREQLKTILTTEQFTQWDQKFQDVRSRWMPPGPGPGSPGNPPGHPGGGPGFGPPGHPGGPPRGNFGPGYPDDPANPQGDFHNGPPPRRGPPRGGPPGAGEGPPPQSP